MLNVSVYESVTFILKKKKELMYIAVAGGLTMDNKIVYPQQTLAIFFKNFYGYPDSVLQFSVFYCEIT